MAAAAAWGLSQWDAMEQYVNCIPRDTQDGAFYRAVLAVHRRQYIAAQQVILLTFQIFRMLSLKFCMWTRFDVHLLQIQIYFCKADATAWTEVNFL
jgi:phosphatidylinositol kinase/protein kinase (PI-3  family)